MGDNRAIQLSKAQYVFPELVPQALLNGDALRALEHRAGYRPVPDLLPGRNLTIEGTVLSTFNMHEHGDLFVRYLRARREIFIDEKGWDLPQTDGMEFDQYDTPLARHIVIHEDRKVLASVRISPTTMKVGPNSYMIRDAQLGLIDGFPDEILYFAAPVDPLIWEATRLYVSRDVPADRRLRVQSMLLNTMAAAARAEGAQQVIGIVPAVFRRWMNRLGMTATAVGPPMRFGNDKTQAALMNVAQPQA